MQRLKSDNVEFGIFVGVANQAHQVHVPDPEVLVKVFQPKGGSLESTVLPPPCYIPSQA